jgi:hypothetical protein
MVSNLSQLSTYSSVFQIYVKKLALGTAVLKRINAILILNNQLLLQQPISVDIILNRITKEDI